MFAIEMYRKLVTPACVMDSRHKLVQSSSDIDIILRLSFSTATLALFDQKNVREHLEINYVIELLRHALRCFSQIVITHTHSFTFARFSENLFEFSINE